MNFYSLDRFPKIFPKDTNYKQTFVDTVVDFMVEVEVRVVDTLDQI